MRTVARVAALLMAAVSIVGCSGDYYRDGIGTDLYWKELPDATEIQDKYIDFICRQADLVRGEPGAEVCNLPQVSRNWATFVQAGMNDIDLRCDAFLSWVDYHRRNDKHIMKQIADTVQAATDIMTVTQVSEKGMLIASAALGLGKNTFVNFSARLLTTADQTTVQTIVLSNQKRYRVMISREIVDNRPAAIHALRSYLRLCLPATIETEINTSSTLVQRGGAGAIAAIERDPLISPVTVGKPMAPRTQQTLPVRPPPTRDNINPAYVSLIRDYDENIDTIRNVKSKLLKICVTPAQADAIDINLPDIRYLIEVFQLNVNLANIQRKTVTVAQVVTGQLTRAEINQITAAVPGNTVCDTRNFANVFEFLRLKPSLTSQPNITRLNKALPTPVDKLPMNATLEQVRAKIPIVREFPAVKEKLVYQNPKAANQITPDLFLALTSLP